MKEQRISQKPAAYTPTAAMHQNPSLPRSLTDAMPALIAYLDCDLRYQYINKTYGDWFGYSETDFIGKGLTEVTNYKQCHDRESYLKRALKGESVSFDVVINTLHGVRHAQVTYIPDLDTRGGVCGVYSLTWGTLASQQAEQSLRKLQYDYAALVNSIDGIVWEADARSLEFIFVSAQAERVLGYPVSAWQGPGFWEKHLHPADREWVMDVCSVATRERRNHNLEYRMIASGGDTVWLRDIVTVHNENDRLKLRGVMIDITEQKRKEERLNYLANYDVLTGLPNRSLFLDRLERVLAYNGWCKRPMALVCIGINRFKRINESLGHEAGDQVLEKVAGYLRNVVREQDTVARLAGNEFALILAEMSRQTDVAHVMDKVFTGLSNPFRVANQDVPVKVSVGISTPSNDCRDARTLLKRAEFAMHSVKKRNTGNNGFQHYSEALGAQISNTLAMENALRRALYEDKLELYYQPQINLGDGTITAVEALLRWPRADTSEMVTPEVIVPLAEESALIVPLGAWVLHRACHDYQRWQQLGLAPPRIAVNISAIQFQSQSLVNSVKQVLSDHQMRASQLELELTESVLQTPAVAEQMDVLAGLGAHIAVDDFGVGYSSLSYLKHLPVHKLKIDRSFLRGLPQDEDNRALVEAIIGMAKSLKLQVVAEGVENAAQRRYLRTRGCDQAQGYLFSRPRPAAELESLLAEPRRLVES